MGVVVRIVTTDFGLDNSSGPEQAYFTVLHVHLISVTFLTFVEFEGSNGVHFTHFQSIRQESSVLRTFALLSHRFSMRKASPFLPSTSPQSEMSGGLSFAKPSGISSSGLRPFELLTFGLLTRPLVIEALAWPLMFGPSALSFALQRQGFDLRGPTWPFGPTGPWCLGRWAFGPTPSNPAESQDSLGRSVVDPSGQLLRCESCSATVVGSLRLAGRMFVGLRPTLIWPLQRAKAPTNSFFSFRRARSGLRPKLTLLTPRRLRLLGVGPSGQDTSLREGLLKLRSNEIPLTSALVGRIRSSSSMASPFRRIRSPSLGKLGDVWGPLEGFAFSGATGGLSRAWRSSRPIIFGPNRSVGWSSSVCFDRKCSLAFGQTASSGQINLRRPILRAGSALSPASSSAQLFEPVSFELRPGGLRSSPADSSSRASRDSSTTPELRLAGPLESALRANSRCQPQLWLGGCFFFIRLAWGPVDVSAARPGCETLGRSSVPSGPPRWVSHPPLPPFSRRSPS